MTPTHSNRWFGAAAVSGTVVVLAVAAGALLLLLGGPGGAPMGSPTPPVATTPETVPSPPPPTVASPSPSPSPTGPAITDLPALVPDRVRAFELDRSRRATRLEDVLGADDGRRLYYARDDGRVVRHVVAVFADDRAARRALRHQREQLLLRRGARVVDDTGLEDREGARRGRLVEVRTGAGELITLWRNRNLVALLGPAPPRLNRRLYSAWPY